MVTVILTNMQRKLLKKIAVAISEEKNCIAKDLTEYTLWHLYMTLGAMPSFKVLYIEVLEII